MPSIVSSPYSTPNRAENNIANKLSQRIIKRLYFATGFSKILLNAA